MIHPLYDKGMFTGLIKDIGTIKKIIPNESGKIFIIESKKLISQINIDDSVATNGVCLTATKVEGNCFYIQAVHVTLEKSTLSTLKQGSLVNLELALLPTERLGGHFVQGHVNGIGSIQSINKKGNNYEITIKTNQELFKYMISEGSIAVDGISLTISALGEGTFCLSIIPHTFEQTILHKKRVGDLVNIEVDMMAKYLENFMKFNKKESYDWKKVLSE